MATIVVNHAVSKKSTVLRVEVISTQTLKPIDFVETLEWWLTEIRRGLAQEGAERQEAVESGKVVSLWGDQT